MLESDVYNNDNNGNVLTVTVTAYSGGAALPSQVTENYYDSFNQLIKTQTTETIVENVYNGEGLRVKKRVSKGTVDTVTKYIYEYNQVVQELDASGNQIARNVYGTNLLMRTVGGQSLYYMYNGHADVTALIDATTGSVVGTYYYDAFGNLTDTTGNANNSITYAGYQYDKETGLYYCNARMYDPKIARFLQEDTYTGDPNDSLSLNLYTYCHNEPLMYSDPTGHKSVLLGHGGETRPIDVYEYDAEISKYVYNDDGEFVSEDCLTTDYIGGEKVYVIRQRNVCEIIENYLSLGKKDEKPNYLSPWKKDDKQENSLNQCSWMDVYKYNKNCIVEEDQGTGKDGLIGPKNLVASDDCIKFIRDYEKLETTMYDALHNYTVADLSNPSKRKEALAKGDWTIGWGHKLFGSEIDAYTNKKITNEKADELFKNDLQMITDTTLKPFLINNNIKLNQHQYDALASFTFNLGQNYWAKQKDGTYRNLAPVILNGDYSEKKITDGFMGYVNKSRRKQEANMFISGNYDSSH